MLRWLLAVPVIDISIDQRQDFPGPYLIVVRRLMTIFA
jgi:hypothetical protein